MIEAGNLDAIIYVLLHEATSTAIRKLTSISASPSAAKIKKQKQSKKKTV